MGFFGTFIIVNSFRPNNQQLVIPMNRILKAFMLLFMCLSIGYAQQNATTHTVIKGETILVIAKTYNVTPYDILQANPNLNSLDAIQEHDVLIIPKSKIKSPQLESASDAIKSSVPTLPYTYTVKKGETKFGLSKRFGITVPELEALNPQIIAGLNEGHVLKIRSLVKDLPEDENSEPNQITTTYDAYRTHIVLKGQTLFSISKINGLTVDQLVDYNSDVLDGVLKEGQILKVPQLKQDANANFKTYVVKPGETKYGLSKQFQTTVEALERLNPHILSMLQVGQVLKIPANDAVSINSKSDSPTLEVQKSPIVSNPVTTKTATASALRSDLPESNDENSERSSTSQINNVSRTTKDTFNTPSKIDLTTARYADLSKTLTIDKSKKLMFFLPFTDEEFILEKANSKNFNSVKDEFDRSHLEFYSGAKIAVDSLKKLGLIVNVNILEAENPKQNLRLTDILKDSDMTDADAIVLPFYGTIEEDVATAVAQQNIPVITAATIAPQQSNKNLFSALPSINQQRIKLLDHIISKGGNIIVVSDVNRSESKDFIQAYVPYAKFVEIKKNGNYNEDDLMSKLKTDKLNFVILDSERNSVFLNVTNTLLSELNTYNLQLAVLESSLIPDSDDVSVKRYRILKMLVPSLTSPTSNSNTQRFSQNYQKAYDSKPTSNALLGFDITFDTLLRLAQKANFEVSAKNDITEYTKLKFNYKTNSQGGYNNEGIYILQYDTDLDLKEVN